MSTGSGGAGGINVSLMLMRWRIQSLERELEQLRTKRSDAELCSVAAERLRLGLSLDRPEAAAILGVSTKKLQRMEVEGKLQRCSDISGVVRYSASDVQRLASAR